MKNPRVSVVTPVYNGAPYLRECIESVLAQDYPNWDYTIVDNCSTDGTREIADEYVARDPRIRVVSNATFAPVMANHNIAARQISPESKYCKFVLADDWLFPECLSRMVAVAEAHPSVAIVGAYGLRGAEVWWYGLPYPSTVVAGREVCRLKLLAGVYPFGTPTSVLYRANTVRSRQAFFNEANLHADKEVCLDVLQDHDFGFVHQVLSFTRTDNDSLTSSYRRFIPHWPARLDDLVRYGPVYLTEAEREQCLTTHLTRYYAFLARFVLEVRDREVFAFHREKLRELGHPLSRVRLTRAIISRVLDLALNPGQSLSSVWRHARRRGLAESMVRSVVVRGSEGQDAGSSLAQLATVDTGKPGLSRAERDL
ncbi:MAG: glycosyltransferase [Luteitalea sp.]|nr:glycosyltransferase [Luteitalea sp.]